MTALVLSLCILQSKQERGTENAQQIYKRISPSVMTLTVQRADGSEWNGTAYMCLRAGIAATAFHVIKDAVKVVASFSDGQKVESVGFIDGDEDRDIALIRVGSGTRPPLRFAKAEPEVGAKAFVIGAPRGLEFSISDGIVSQIRRASGKRFFQFTCPSSPGNSGGPLIDERGEIIGTVSWQVVDGQNLNFAVPSTYFQDLDVNAVVRPWRTETSDAKPSSSSSSGTSRLAKEFTKSLGSNSISAVAVSKDGTLAVVAADGVNVRLLDLKLQTEKQLIAFDSDVRCLEISNSKTFAICGLTDGTVQSIDIGSGRIQFSASFDSRPSSLQISPDDAIIVANLESSDSARGRCVLLSAGNGAVLRTTDDLGLMGTAQLSPDNLQLVGLAFNSSSKDIQVAIRRMSLIDGHPLSEISSSDLGQISSSRSELLTALAITPTNGLYVVRATIQNKAISSDLLLINGETGLVKRDFDLGKEAYSRLIVGGRGAYAVALGATAARVLDLGSGSVIATFDFAGTSGTVGASRFGDVMAVAIGPNISVYRVPAISAPVGQLVTAEPTRLLELDALISRSMTKQEFEGKYRDEISAGHVFLDGVVADPSASDARVRAASSESRIDVGAIILAIQTSDKRENIRNWSDVRRLTQGLLGKSIRVRFRTPKGLEYELGMTVSY